MNASRGTPYINKSFYAAPLRSAGNVRIIHRTEEVVTIANSKMQSEILLGASASGTHTLSQTSKKSRNFWNKFTSEYCFASGVSREFLRFTEA